MLYANILKKMKELIAIQDKLNAPKSQYNAFGKYSYRSCEDILAAVKPHLTENKCVLLLKDEIEQIGDRYYVKAIAKLVNSEGVTEEVSAYAREDESKKGMDGAQITGAASSYARKYALNGLFCIDDTKDPDATNKGEKQVAAHSNAPVPAVAPNRPADLDEAIDKALQSATMADLQAIWKQYAHLQGYPDFNNAKNQRKNELTLAQ